MLTFPTMAEQAYKEFQSATKTIALATIAKRRGAQVERTFEGVTTYWFDDDTSLVVKGRGKNYQVEVMLP